MNDNWVADDEILMRSVSQYDGINANATRDALKDASNQLFPLADYVENNFVPQQETTQTRAHHDEDHHLDGGQTFLEGGEFLVQALNAFASSVTIMAENFNLKLVALERDVHELKHRVDTAGTMISMNRQHEALNGIKKIASKRPQKDTELPGAGHKRDGEFSISSAYRRKRIDYNKFDEIGHGHEIHRDLFEDEPPEENRDRSDSIHGNLLNVKDKGLDTVSMGSSTSTLGRRSSVGGLGRKSAFPTMPRKSAFPTLPSHSSFQGTSSSKKKTSLTFRTTAKALIALTPKDRSMGASFPVVPDSPGFILPEPKFPPTTSRQDSFDMVPPPPCIVIDDSTNCEKNDSENVYENIDMFALPPLPESPPPELPTFREGNLSENSNPLGFNRMSMIPEPDF